MKATAEMRMIPLEVSFAEWRCDPKYIEAYDPLEEEFVRAAQKIGGRRLLQAAMRQVADAVDAQL